MSDKKTSNKPSGSKGWRHALTVWGLNILAACAVFALALYLTFGFLARYTRHGEYIAVPDINQMPILDAQRTLQDNQLKAAVIDSVYSPDCQPGAVMDYSPTAGHKVKQGRTVYITINNMSVPDVAVPDVANNSSVRQAVAMLRASGFKLTPHDSIPGQRDWVFAVKLGDSTLVQKARVPKGATLTLVIGNGEDVMTVQEDSIANKAKVDTEADDNSWF